MTDNTVLNRQSLSRIELYSDLTNASALDSQPTKANGIIHPSVDRNARTSRRDQRACNRSIVHDADCLGDRERAVACCVEHIDLAACVRLIMRSLQGAAWRCQTAGVCIVALGRHKGSGVLRQRRRGGSNGQRAGCDSKEFSHNAALWFFERDVRGLRMGPA